MNANRFAGYANKSSLLILGHASRKDLGVLGPESRHNGATAMSVMYIWSTSLNTHLSISPLTFHPVHFCISILPTFEVSHLARSFASPSLDLELDANLTCVSRMRQNHPSTIFEYEIVR